MNNLLKFEDECLIAYENGEIDRLDKKLLFKIAKAINEEDSNIEMELEPFYYADRHSIKCNGICIDNFESKIKNAVKKAYVVHKNIEFGYSHCRVKIPSAQYPKSVNDAISERRDKNMYNKISEKRKQNCHFANLVDFIVTLAEKGKYEKCDGIIEDFIRNFDTSALITEEEMINDLKTVIDGSYIDENDNDAYTDDVYAIADKYNTNVSNIQGILQIKIRCFDRDYIYRQGFFDLNTQDHQIIERKLKGEPWGDVEEFKLLSEIEL